ncbi:DUF4145 domain-containing protein [Lactiplantibacillus plantarum]|uniref:DUF4145 domain-containing protein n=1 Tax=Lactiplantibacillus plantarum TaxID=1590 RepID=UPI0007BB3A69|nr:DUF4145 domain-containing protein [Lactiplantibacillus plantarum]KZU84714.1 hypothetical protein Nizo3400_1694 [Lactiplantibacillus plantarum]
MAIYDTGKYNIWGGTTIVKASYVCGYCGQKVTSNRGMALEYPDNVNRGVNDKPYGVFVCTNCNLPTFIYDDVQVPGSNFGEEVNSAPKKVTEIYNEARKSYSTGAFTGVILLCRVLLNHVAVSLGADDDKTFAFYVSYLTKNHYIPTGSSEWIDSIRKLGNTANHDLAINTRAEAETIIKFCEMLLKITYEYPSTAQNLLNDSNR